MIALIVLGWALADQERLVEAEDCLQRAIEQCEATGDVLHLGVAVGNRVFLWVKRGDLRAAVADLRRCIALARQLGYVPLERIAHHNLAEFLLWLGNHDEAEPLATHAHELQTRFFADCNTPLDALLLARIQIDRGERARAESSLRWIAERFADEILPPPVRALRDRVALALRPYDGAAWRRTIEAGRECAVEQQLEILHAAFCHARVAEQPDEAEAYLRQGQLLAQRSTIWAQRFAARVTQPSAATSDEGPR